MQLTKFDPAGFLSEYWQQRPLLIRDPWDEWRSPLTPDELAGLACEAEVESRLITSDRGRLAAEDGPLPEIRFGRLGKSPWTLLVQAADQHVPGVAALIEPFRFIPNWRIDDVMVSYATDGGGVGAHFDQYDVFLIQGLGQRRWYVGGPCSEDSALLPHDDLRLLADFEPVCEWLLNPGDILYLPPGIAHNGVAEGDDCMTYSVGFRAPSRSELIRDYCAHLIADMADDDRYTDPGLMMQDNPGEISATDLARLHNMVKTALDDEAAFARWFGIFNSSPKYPEMDWSPEYPVDRGCIREMLGVDRPLIRNPASRFSFIRQKSGSILLFIDGEYFVCERETALFAETLCAYPRMTLNRVIAQSEPVWALLEQLLNRGNVTFEN